MTRIKILLNRLNSRVKIVENRVSRKADYSNLLNLNNKKNNRLNKNEQNFKNLCKNNKRSSILSLEPQKEKRKSI